MFKFEFKLRVSCVTFNHSKYIEEALKGFCMQQTDFPFVCTIIDDASTDGEQAVLERYVSEHFDLSDNSVAFERETSEARVTFAQHKENKSCYFVVIYLKENHYSQRKSKAPYVEEWDDVKYIALCEGDDYWTDPYKLQKQVDFLEGHEEYSMCVTNCATKLGNRFGVGNHYIWDTYTTEQVLLHNSRVSPRQTGDEIGPIAHTSTFVYRNFNVPTPAWMNKCFIGDEPITIWMSTYGKIKFLNEKTSVYRQNVGVSSRDFSFEKDYLNRIQMYKAVNEGLDFEYDSLICNKIISRYYKKLIRLYYHNKRYAKMLGCAFNYLYNLYK